MNKEHLLAGLNPPQGDSFPKMCVDVRLACGRYYLNVFGLVVAVEGDMCREPKYQIRFWDRETLERAAKDIREGIVFLFEEIASCYESEKEAERYDG